MMRTRLLRKHLAGVACIASATLTLLIGCEPPQSKFPLRFEAHRQGIDIEITNRDKYDWHACIVQANLMSVENPGYRYGADVDVAAGETVRIDGLKFTAGVNGGGALLNPLVLFNIALKCQTPFGVATGAAIKF